MAVEIDTFNAQGVGGRGNTIVVLMPKREMTKMEALVHAAYLVTLAEMPEYGVDRNLPLKEFEKDESFKPTMSYRVCN